MGNEAFTYDSLCPTFVILRCWSLADMVRPWTLLAGSRFKLMILSNRLTILISVHLSPLTSFTTDGRPGYMHISQAGLSRRILDGAILTMPGFLTWLTEEMRSITSEPLTFAARKGTVQQISIHPHDSRGRLELMYWDPDDRRCRHMLDQNFSAGAPLSIILTE